MQRKTTKTTRRRRPSWRTRIRIWKLVAEGRSDDRILEFFSKSHKYPDAPKDRGTISRIRKQFDTLDRGHLLRAIREADELKGLLKDERILWLMVRVFSRPAFETQIAREHSVPDFIQAIGDTIDALNTGDLKARDGRLLEHIPTLYDLKDDSKRAVIQRILAKLNQLRIMWDDGLRDGSIKQLQIGWMIPPGVAASMEALRNDILADFGGIYPKFGVERIALRLSDST